MRDMTVSSIICLLSSMFMIVTSSSAGDFYAGLDYLALDLESGAEVNANPGAIRFRLGVQPTEIFALEAHVGTGIHDDIDDITVPVVGKTSVSFKVDGFWGLYGVGIWPIHENLKLFASAGVTEAEVNIGSLGTSDETGFSWGVGAELLFRDTIGGVLRYESLIDGGEFDLEAYTLGVNVYF